MDTSRSGARLSRISPVLVLSLGFGGLVAFLLAAAVGALVLLDGVRGDDTRIRQSFLSRLQALEQIRAQIYLSSSDVRDFLLAPDPHNAESQRGPLRAIEADTRSSLNAYAQSLDPDEADAFAALHGEIDAWWQVLNTTFDWTAAQRSRLRYTFFYEQLVPRRTTMLRIADRIAAINERGLNRAEEKLASSAEKLRSQLLITFGFALAGGIGLAVLTVVYTRRLQEEVERRLRESSEARSNLRDLSARLLRTQEEERRNLARELHDEVGQSLSAILMEAGSAESARTNEEAGQRIRAIAAIAERTLNGVRDLALLLRPSMLDDFGLIPALNWHAREVAKRTGIDIRISADEASAELPDEHKTCIYRVVQEAIHNATRHASASAVLVSVRTDSDWVRFSVKDDGAGFDNRGIRGLGLLGMQERVDRLGGILEVDSHPGRGTLIAAELPLPQFTSIPIHAAHSNITG